MPVYSHACWRCGSASCSGKRHMWVNGSHKNKFVRGLCVCIVFTSLNLFGTKLWAVEEHNVKHKKCQKVNLLAGQMPHIYTVGDKQWGSYNMCTSTQPVKYTQFAIPTLKVKMSVTAHFKSKAHTQKRTHLETWGYLLPTLANPHWDEVTFMCTGSKQVTSGSSCF